MGIDIFAVAYIAGLYEFLADGAYAFRCISAQQPCGGVCFACIGVDALTNILVPIVKKMRVCSSVKCSSTQFIVCCGAGLQKNEIASLFEYKSTKIPSFPASKTGLFFIGF